MIKRVYQEQVQIWEDMHSKAVLSRLPGPLAKCRFNDDCDPTVLPARLFSILSNLDEEARQVRETVRLLKFHGNCEVQLDASK